MQTPPRGKRDCTDDQQTRLREQADAVDAPAQRTSIAFWWICLLIIALADGAYAALRLHVFPAAPARAVAFLERVALGIGGVALLLAFYRLLDNRLRAIPDVALRYNVRRIGKLVLATLVLVIALTVLFANWYAALTSLGLISIVLGFSLQTPLGSFIGWIYILTKRPY